MFIGLGASQTAQAQATIADAFVTLNERGTTSDYNVVAGVVGTPNFIDRDFGTFDLSVASDVFQLTAGNLVIDENGGDPFDEGFLSVRVFQGSLANNAGATQFVNIPL
ncbi:MAG TPA: hypothetical protein VF629_06520, partial [Hymenobacter sp.]|uniref:hypothetical protein n=1 Tax=Hymenobacter sp. TaxID=1898978 RepID=UPI002ED7A9BD